MSGLAKRSCLVLAAGGTVSLVAGFAVLVTVSVPGLPGAGSRAAATAWGLLGAGMACGVLLLVAGLARAMNAHPGSGREGRARPSRL